MPFQEAIDYLRGKLTIPTERWDDLQGEINAKAFTVAGATKTDLLADIHQAINDAAANGTTITDFRKQFDEAVAKYGWSYKGSRGWRTRVIYDNNLGSAFAAGKWQQIQRTQDSRPYLEYVTAGDARVRPEHAAWEGKVLPIDDSWWNTHYPPNGWNCRCTVRTLSQDQMESERLTVSQAPPLDLTERINPSTGEVYGKVPKGIDVGWDYNVGKVWLGPDAAFGEKIMSLPKGMRDAALAAVPGIIGPKITDSFRRWARNALDAPNPVGSQVTAGYLDEVVVNYLERRGITPETAIITIDDAKLRRMMRDLKRRLGKDLADEDLVRMAEILANPQAVLFDIKNPALAYIFDIGQSGRAGKFVVRVNFKTKGEIGNSVRSGDVTPAINLQDKNQWDIIKGKL